MTARLLRLTLLALSCLALAATTAGAATVVNGDFEGGDVGWQGTNSLSGSWLTYTGDTFETSPVPAAHGTTPISDQGDPASGALYQDVSLEPGLQHVLKVNYWARSFAPWTIPDPLKYDLSSPVQHVRIDVIKAAANPMTGESSDILATVWAPKTGDSTTIDWTAGSVDLTAFAGQTVRIRALYAVTGNVANLAVDDFAITSTDVAAPLLTSVATSSPSYTLGTKKLGLKLSFTANEAGTAKITIEKASKGKKSGAKCVKPTSKNKKAKNCTAWKAIKGTVSLPLVSGANTYAFNGKFGGKKLGAGTYRFSVVASDANGNTAAPIVKTFKVKPAKKK